MNKSWGRIVSTLVAILIALGPVFTCVPTAPAAEGHCKPTESMKAGCSHCPQKDVMDCCATSAPQPAVPQDASSPQANSRTMPTGSPAPADLASAAPALQPPAVARTVRGAPLHGFRSTDLPTLYAVFLI